MHNHTVQQVNSRPRHIHQAVHRYRDGTVVAGGFHQTGDDADHHGGAVRQPAGRTECRRQQNPGGGQFLVVGDGCDDADDQDIERSTGDEVAHHHDGEQKQDEPANAALLGDPVQQSFDFMNGGGFLQGRGTNHKAHNHDYVVICEAAESSGHVCLLSHNQQCAGDQRRSAEGQLVTDDNRDHQDDDCQGDNHR